MNSKSLLLAALLGAGVASAQAGELYTPEQYTAPAQSTLTRAQVKQQVLQARANGELNHNDVDLPAAVDTPFGKTRSSVKSEVLAARETGGLDHNDVDLPAVAKGSVLTRQEVKAEAIAARAQSRNAPGRNTIDY